MRYLLPLLFCALCLPLRAQEASLTDLYVESIQAYKTHDYAKYLQIMIRMDSMRPSHPTYTYNLASAYAMNGKKEEALRTLRQLILLNNSIDFETDSDFSSLMASPDWDQLAAERAAMNQPVVHSSAWVELSEMDLHPEGIAFLPRQKRWLAGSIRKAKIVSFDTASGICSDWLVDSSMLSVFALKVDAKGKYLWAATSAIAEMEGYSTVLEGKNEILKIDIEKREIVDRFEAPGKHVLGDILLSPKGDVYISDSDAPMIYWIKSGKKQLEVWLDLEKEAFNLQGICLSGDDKQLYVADYLKGILRIPLGQKEQRQWLAFPDNASRKGIDGLSWHAGKLYAIHNGLNPIRILEYTLDATGSRIEKAAVLDHNRPEFREPTLGFISGDTFYFIANSPWSAYKEDFSFDPDKLRKPALYRLDLGKR